jgi:hypothetical protein
MPDDYEFVNGLNPLLDDAGLDLDGDGTDNLTECRFGTDPGDPADRVQLVISPGVPGSNTLNFIWPSVAGKTYLLYSSSDLLDWRLETPVASFGDAVTAYTFLGNGGPRRFFLISVDR